jgi:hypothetical protein
MKSLLHPPEESDGIKKKKKEEDNDDDDDDDKDDDLAQTILFTNDKAVVRKESGRVYTAEELAEDTSVLFFDEGKDVGSKSGESSQLVRPTTTAHSRR